MPMAGNTYSTLVREVWTPKLETTVFRNNWMLDGSTFPVVDARGSGTTISTGYEYAITSNTGTFNHDDPMVEPFASSQIKAYFNKDYFQESARLFGQYLDAMAGAGTEPSFSAIEHELDSAAKNLLDIATTTMLADLEVQIDAGNTYSDAALNRGTYATLLSYEEDTSTALTLAHLEDAVEALMTHTTYGQQVRSESDLLWLFPRNQVTNLSRLAGGQAYNADLFHMTTSTQDMGAMDAGRVFRTKQFEGIEMRIVPDQTTTTILLVHKPDITIYRNRPLTITEKTENADSLLWQLTCGYNAICKCPGNSGKLSAKDA